MDHSGCTTLNKAVTIFYNTKKGDQKYESKLFLTLSVQLLVAFSFSRLDGLVTLSDMEIQHVSAMEAHFTLGTSMRCVTSVYLFMSH